MGLIQYPDSLGSIINDLDRRLRALETAPQSVASVSVQDAAHVQRVLIGLLGDGTTYGMQVNDSLGNVIYTSKGTSQGLTLNGALQFDGSQFGSYTQSANNAGINLTHVTGGTGPTGATFTTPNVVQPTVAQIFLFRCYIHVAATVGGPIWIRVGLQLTGPSHNETIAQCFVKASETTWFSGYDVGVAVALTPNSAYTMTPFAATDTVGSTATIDTQNLYATSYYIAQGI